MGALENYKARVTGTIGSSLKEYVKNQVRTNLDIFLEKSQYGMDVSIYDIDSEEWDSNRIGIMTGAMTDIRDEVLVLSKINVLKMGTLFKWDDEYWVVVKREARVIKESFYGTAYRCNVDLKWVDKEGKLRSQKAYAKGRGMSSILVENKYTEPPVMAREVDTPITVITQRNLDLEQDMRFLFNGQPYRVTFVDNLSTDGTTILGMYDDILQDGDDVVNNIANYNKRYEIKLDFESDVVLEVNQPFEVTYSVFRNGEPVETKDIIISVEDDSSAKIEGNIITPLKATDIVVRVGLKDNELVYQDFVIHSGDEWIKDNIFIVGPDKIVWNGAAEYYLNNKANAEFIPTFPTKVKGSFETTENSIKISVKDKYAGTINLVVITADSEIYTKDIKIISAEEV